MIKKVMAHSGLSQYVFEVLSTHKISPEKCRQIQEVVFDKLASGYDFYGFTEEMEKDFYKYSWRCNTSCD
jgi:hypothetical protein